MRVIGRVYEVIVDRLVHLSKTAFRMTEGIDQVQRIADRLPAPARWRGCMAKIP
jgi:hypothetical protein